MARQATADTASFIEHLKSRELVSNVEFEELQKVD
jgi:hypothetical protein